MTKKIAKAIAAQAIKAGFIIDTHNEKNVKMNIECALLVHNKETDSWNACWASNKYPYFSVNPINKIDGELYLSTYALGPNVDLRTKSLETAIADMNEFYAEPSVNNGFSAFEFELVK